MDPNAVWARALAGSEQAAEDMADWLNRGGFPPTGMTKEECFALMPARLRDFRWKWREGEE